MLAPSASHTLQCNLKRSLKELSHLAVASLTGLSGPTNWMALNPDFGSTGFPPLPGIISGHIQLQVFTHRSFFARPTHIFEDLPDDPSPDNEKFEHLGDSVLGLVVTGLLLEMYPCLRVGPSTKIRGLIVGNATLAEISLRYKLPDRLRLHLAQAITLRASINIQADVFESYVGGLYTDQGLPVVKGWLETLFRPYVVAAYTLIRAQHGLPPTPSTGSFLISHSTSLATHLPPPPLTTTIGHLALFNQHLQRKKVEWIYSNVGGDGRGSKTTPVWMVKVLVDGVHFGEGKGGTKKFARNEAAKQGLEKLGVVVWADFWIRNVTGGAGSQHGISRLGLDAYSMTQKKPSRSNVKKSCMLLRKGRGGFGAGVGFGRVGFALKRWRWGRF